MATFVLCFAALTGAMGTLVVLIPHSGAPIAFAAAPFGGGLLAVFSAAFLMWRDQHRSDWRQEALDRMIADLWRLAERGRHYDGPAAAEAGSRKVA